MVIISVIVHELNHQPDVARISVTKNLQGHDFERRARAIVEMLSKFHLASLESFQEWLEARKMCRVRIDANDISNLDQHELALLVATLTFYMMEHAKQHSPHHKINMPEYSLDVRDFVQSRSDFLKYAHLNGLK